VDSILTSEITLSRKLIIMTVFTKKRISSPLSKGSFSSFLRSSDPRYSNHRTISVRVSNHAEKRIGVDVPPITNYVESWVPLKIPLVLVLTASFVISLVLGDVSSFLVA
jgi:hypothetical protein